MIEATVVILRKCIDEKTLLLLPRIKCGWCAPYHAGVGGKRESGESIEDCAVRETQEELGVEIDRTGLTRFAQLDDLTFNEEEELSHRYRVYYFFADKWEGFPRETAEADPADSWFEVSDLPWQKMFPTYPLFLPVALKGRQKPLSISCLYDKDRKPLELRFLPHQEFSPIKPRKLLPSLTPSLF